MATQIIQATILLCDGCSAEMGTEGQYRTAMDARAAAYALGWRFVPMVTASGDLSSATSDVCPSCQEGWVPQTRLTKRRGGRRLVDGTVRYSQ